MTEREGMAWGRIGLTAGQRRFGMGTAVAVVLGVVVSAAVAVTTPPRSGPYCRTDCVRRPWTDVAEFVPRDYWWMYAMILLLAAALALAVTVHGMAAGDRPLPSLTGVCLAAAATALLVADYGIQLTVVQPALLAGETDGLALWSQYNPHGLFIALENVGYAAWGLAFVLLGSSLARRRGGTSSAAGWTLVAGGLLILTALVAYAVAYGADLEYRFEVTALTVTWLTLAATGVLVALTLERAVTAPLNERDLIHAG